MKKLVLIFMGVLVMSCSSVEQRIKEHSYTNEWYYMGTERYQVYKTKSGERYIIVLNKKETDFKRKYIN
jgi:hypothetical protein